MGTNTSTATSSDAINPRQRMIQNFLLIWIDANIDQSTQDCQNTLSQLRSVVNDINIFTQQDECIDFLTEVNDMKTFLILGGTLGAQIVPLIHDIPQLDGIYIFSGNKFAHERWTKEWGKIKGVHTEIKPICEALQLAARQCNQDSIPVSFIRVNEGTSNVNLNQLEPSFMYTQIFKEILLEMEHDEQSVKNFILFWREHYINNTVTLNVIAEFERDYCPQSSIRWYTREYFLYQILNRALRLLEADTIINMGFFIRDLHRQLEELHQKQLDSYHGQPFIIYRGQGLSKADVEKLLKTQGGLISFNNFLSTSKDRDISLFFAECVSGNTDTVGILFKMSIDPSVSSAPFASIKDVSYFQEEEEVLFSMHTVFRICEIIKIDNNNSLYQVNLTLTADDDQELRTLTERIRDEVRGETGWHRFGKLLIRLSQIDKAEELYNVLLEQTSDQSKKALYYNQLGYIKCSQGDYEKAIWYHEKGIEIKQKILPANHLHLATSYNNIGEVYKNMGEYSKALSYNEKGLEIQQKSLPQNHPDLATSYNKIAAVYYNMGHYSKALLYAEKALENVQKTLPANHPDFAVSYSNIGEMYRKMGDFSKALSYYEKTLEIKHKIFPATHPDFGQSYNNIGMVYYNMGEYSKTLSYYERALEIWQKTLPANHPYLAVSYNNIGEVYRNMDDCSKALSYYEKALEIQRKMLPQNHPDLAQSYNNIGAVYHDMDKCSKALSYYERALEIWQKTLPPNHPHLATSYNNIGMVYNKMGECSKALSYYERALEIFKKTLPSNHPYLATSYNNIGGVYENMGECSKALLYYERALEIFKKTLPANHPHLATSCNNIGGVYDNMGEYSKALLYYEKALEIFKKTLPPNHPNVAVSYRNIAVVHEPMKEYSKALSYFKCAQNILQFSLPPNHPYAQVVQESIERVKKKLLTNV